MENEEGVDEKRLGARIARQSQDFADLQNELADRDVGRISRFIGESSETRVDRGKRRAERDAELTALQIMLSVPIYAQLFRETQTQLRNVQSRMDTALQAIQNQRTRIEQSLRTSSLMDEERREQEEHLEALKELENDILKGQAEIGDMQERMDDEENPPSAEDLRNFQNRANAIVADIEARVEAQIGLANAPTREGARDAAPVAEIAVPEL